MCPFRETCYNHELTSAGLYPVVLQVLDVDCVYYMVTEYLECSHCKKKDASPVVEELIVLLERHLYVIREKGWEDNHKMAKDPDKLP